MKFYKRKGAGPTISYQYIILATFSALILAFLLIPSLMAVPMSISNTDFLKFPPQGKTLRWYKAFLTDSDWVRATLFSLRVAVITTIFSLCVGFTAALAVIRGHIPGKTTVTFLIVSPIMVPVIIIAVASYGVFAKMGLLGTNIGVAAAHSIIAIPYSFLVFSANLSSSDVTLEMAARNCGASPHRTFFSVTLPLMKPAILASAIFSFVTSLDELILSLFVVGITKTTLPIKIFQQIQWRLDPVVAAASTVFIIAAFLLLAVQIYASQKVQGRTSAK